MTLIEQMEHLAGRLNSLREAEELAAKAYPTMLPELRRLHKEAVRALFKLVKKVLKAHPMLGTAGPRIPLEALERMFAVLRDQAEREWTLALKLTGPEAKRARLQADQFARFAHSAAIALKIAAEGRGVWSKEYAAYNGLDPWI